VSLKPQKEEIKRSSLKPQPMVSKPQHTVFSPQPAVSLKPQKDEIKRSSSDPSLSSSPEVYPEKGLSQTFLDERLSLYGLKEKTKIKGDGNCQFAGCADQLFDDATKHSEIRKAACDWLRKNSSYKLPNQTTIHDYLQTEFFPTWDDYCDYMSQDGMWGDHFTLIAIAEIYQTKIVVVSSMEVKPGIDPFTVIVPKIWNGSKIIYLSHLHELHYSSVCVDDTTV